MKRLLLVACIACSGKSPTESMPMYTVMIQPSSSFRYVSPKHYELTVVRSTSQTIARLDASTDAPDLTKFIWESDKTWQYVVFDEKFDVPTINCCSYSYQRTVHTILAPVMSMVGDSMYVVVSARVNEKHSIADTIVVKFK